MYFKSMVVVAVCPFDSGWPPDPGHFLVPDFDHFELYHRWDKVYMVHKYTFFTQPIPQNDDEPICEMYRDKGGWGFVYQDDKPKHCAFIHRHTICKTVDGESDEAPIARTLVNGRWRRLSPTDLQAHSTRCRMPVTASEFTSNVSWQFAAQIVPRAEESIHVDLEKFHSELKLSACESNSSDFV